jgi:uncharacterized protein (TIGR02453 family)
MLQEYIKFLAKLDQNNNKTWMDENRQEYKKLEKWFNDFAGDIILKLQKVDKKLGLLTPKDCIFRINRDIRFSKNKNPYKNNRSAAFCFGGKKAQFAGYYFQFDCDGKAFIAGGEWNPTLENLEKYRLRIVKDPSSFLKITSDSKLKKHFKNITGQSLKRNPRGFEKATENLQFIKLKQFLVEFNCDLGEYTNKAFEKIILDKFITMQSLISWLQETSKMSSSELKI